MRSTWNFGRFDDNFSKHSNGFTTCSQISFVPNKPEASGIVGAYNYISIGQLKTLNKEEESYSRKIPTFDILLRIL